MQQQEKGILTGVLCAALAVIIWSGNFVVARLVMHKVQPVSLAFFRWATATTILFPFAYKQLITEKKVILKHSLYFVLIALNGITLFNTFVYIGAHYTTATNLALVGTTSSPIMSIILARIFLKEKIGLQKIVGVTVCITGVFFLLTKGVFNNLFHLHFDKGDLWVLAGAFCFAVYNVMARKKPLGVSPVPFLFVVFFIGTMLLIPPFIQEVNINPSIVWTGEIVWCIAYLGLGTSVICFLIWNKAITKLGAGRTALFGNLIPIFSSIEAVILLHEKFTIIHAIGMMIVFTGIIIANWSLFKKM
jgi:drug/metabolite transporter (DMT)-like permease